MKTIKFFLSPYVVENPSKKNSGDAGYDIAALVETVIEPFKVAKVSTGVYIIPPNGYYIEIKDRSSVASNGRFTGGGIIDSHYRGEVFVCLYNGSNKPVTINAGDRIAQLILRKRYDVTEEYHTATEEVIKLLKQTTERGDKGFGSTGV